MSARFEIPLTGMKNCFKSVYGTSIGAWLTDYRMNRAAEFLRADREQSVAEIARLVPFFCMYQIICQFVEETVTKGTILTWCGIALLAYCVKVLCFAGSTGASHQVAYHVLEGLRLKLADRFLHAPLGDVQSHSIGEIKNVLVDKIEGIEPPPAHVVPEGAGHIVLPVISIIALALTFQISGKNFDTYNKSNAYMNSTIVEYIEGIEVIKAFDRAGVSYEKYSKAITDYRTFVIKWLSSTWVTMKLAFALFPTTLPGTLPASLAKLEVFANEIKQMQMVVEELESLLSIKSLPEPEIRVNVTSTDVELHQVHFSYSGNAEDEVLHGIDLKLPQGRPV